MSFSIPVFPEYTCLQVVLGVCQRATKSSFCWYQKSERDATLYCRGVSGQTLSEVISIPSSIETVQVQCTIRQQLPPFPRLSAVGGYSLSAQWGKTQGVRSCRLHLRLQDDEFLSFRVEQHVSFGHGLPCHPRRVRSLSVVVRSYIECGCICHRGRGFSGWAGPLQLGKVAP